MLDSRQQANLDNPESISVALAAIEWDVALVDNDVRKLLGVMKGKGSETYAGRSSATAEGKAFLQQQIDGLMKEKAQLKEKRMVLLQRQQGFQPGGAMADESAGPPAHQQRQPSSGREKEADKTPPPPPAAEAAAAPKSPSRRRPASPLGARPSPGEACLRAACACLALAGVEGRANVFARCVRAAKQNMKKRDRHRRPDRYAPSRHSVRHLFRNPSPPAPPRSSRFSLWVCCVWMLASYPVIVVDARRVGKVSCATCVVCVKTRTHCVWRRATSWFSLPV